MVRALKVFCCGLLAPLAALAQSGDSARLTDPTERYPHGVFGARFEYAAIEGTCGKLSLPAPEVFEDRRLLQVSPTGASEPHFVTMIAGPREGARLALLRLAGGCLPSIAAQSESIGIGNRWRNPIGMGDFDGDGVAELASIQTPHIGGILQLHELEGDRLVKGPSLRSYSNHRYGDIAQDLAAVVPAASTATGRALVAVPTQTRDVLALIGLQNSRWQEFGRVELAGQVQAVAWTGSALEVTVAGQTSLVQLADLKPEGCAFSEPQ